MFLTVAQIAEKLNISANIVYGWCSQGLTHYRLGAAGKRGAIRIAETDLVAWLDRAKTQKGQPEQPAAPKTAKPKSVFRHISVR